MVGKSRSVSSKVIFYFCAHWAHTVLRVTAPKALLYRFGNMNVSESEWRIAEDRLQRLADLLFWQWRMRLAAWRGDSEDLRVTCQLVEARTTNYIRSLRYVLTVPYTVENRSTVVCERLGIRCIPVPGRRLSTRQPLPGKEPKQIPPTAPVSNIGSGIRGLPATVVPRSGRGTGATRVWGNRRRGTNRTTPSSAMARQDSVRPEQFDARGGRFIDWIIFYGWQLYLGGSPPSTGGQY